MKQHLHRPSIVAALLLASLLCVPTPAGAYTPAPYTTGQDLSDTTEHNWGNATTPASSRLQPGSASESQPTLIAQRRKKKRKKKKRRRKRKGPQGRIHRPRKGTAAFPHRAAAEQDAPAAEQPAPPSAGQAPPSSNALRRGARVEFDGRLVQGQTAKSGAIYLFARKRSELRSMVKEREQYRREILITVYPERDLEDAGEPEASKNK